MKPKILFVDDNLDLLLILEQMLEPQLERWDLNYVSSLMYLNQKLEQDEFQVVVTDMQMPEITGSELLEVIKERNPKTRVIIMTAQPNCDVAVRCMKTGASNYISKPFDQKKLLGAIEHALGEYENYESQNAPEVNSCVRLHPEIVGNFELMEILGQGRFGIVYLARRLGNNEDKLFALKLLITQEDRRRTDDYYLERFKREAQAGMSVTDEYVVKIEEFGVAGDLPYLVMEYIKGRTLKQLFEGGEVFRLNLSRKIDIIRQITKGLSEIHRQGICHRDIKPDNIMVDDDLNVKITDFGIAQLPNSELTLTADQLGTPNYMSPESFLTPKVDQRSDLFSLGVISYQLCVGLLPFTAESIHEISYKIWHRRPVNPRDLVPTLAIGLQYILGKMLKKNVKERYSSATHILADIDDLLYNRGIFQSDNYYSNEEVMIDWRCVEETFLDSHN